MTGNTSPSPAVWMKDIVVDFTVDGGIYLLEINLRDEGARLDALKFTLVE